MRRALTLSVSLITAAVSSICFSSPPLVKFVFLQACPTRLLSNIEILEDTKCLLATLTMLLGIFSVQLEQLF